jgi:uncharacterized protein YecE (DUF72 family)
MLNGSSSIRSGCCGFSSDKGRCFRQLQAVEVQDTFFQPPKSKVLLRWRQRAPSGFSFAIRAFQLITHSSDSPGYRRVAESWRGSLAETGHFRATPLVARATELTFEAARALQCRAVVFDTPASFTPTAVNRRLLTAYFERLDRGFPLVWNAQGIWQPEEVERIAKDLDIHPCLDPQTVSQRDPVRSFCYVRVMQPRCDDGQLWELAAALRGRDGFCLFNGTNMFRDAIRLQGLLAEGNEQGPSES